MTRFCLLAGVALLMTGCGSSNTPPASPDSALATESAAATPPSEPSAASSEQEAEGTKEIKGGLTLPDQLELPSGNESTTEPSGGLTLPSDLQSSNGRRAVEAVMLVSDRVDSAKPKVEVDLRYATLEDFMKQAVRPGKVTVIDFWSMSCIPCLKELPGLVKLQADHPNDLAAVGANLDYDGRSKYPPESYAAKAKTFLSYIEADFPNTILKTPSDEVFKELKMASIPAVFVYDQEGKLVKRFIDSGQDGGFNYHDDIVPLVNELLAR